MPTFTSHEEFRAVVDRVVELMNEDPEMGPRLREADVPQCFEFPDLGQALFLRAGAEGEAHVVRTWDADADWQYKVKLVMSAEVANRYFQGKENIAMAIARRRIKVSGDVRAALSIIPLQKPVFARYREVLEAEYPHLVVV